MPGGGPLVLLAMLTSNEAKLLPIPGGGPMPGGVPLWPGKPPKPGGRPYGDAIALSVFVEESWAADFAADILPPYGLYAIVGLESEFQPVSAAVLFVQYVKAR